MKAGISDFDEWNRSLASTVNEAEWLRIGAFLCLILSPTESTDRSPHHPAQSLDFIRVSARGVVLPQPSKYLAMC